MFPDLSRDDVFRLETARLWLRWPRLIDAPMAQRFCARWEADRHAAGVAHPYPPGSAERFIYAAREGNAMGRELTLVITPKRGRRDAVGSISLESLSADRLALSFALAPEAWSNGLAAEAARAIVNTGFALTKAAEILASVRNEDAPSLAVVKTCGFEAAASTGLEEAPADDGSSERRTFRLSRQSWRERVPAEGWAAQGLSSFVNRPPS